MSFAMKAMRPLLAAAIVVTLPAAARADPAPAPAPTEAPRLFTLSLRAGPRFAQLAPYSHRYQNLLGAYGYGPMPAFLEASVDGAIMPVRWLDFGLHTGYLFGSAGSSGGAGGALSLHTFELGGFARGFVSGVAAGPIAGIGFGAEAGVDFPFLTLRGQVTRARVPYGGPVVWLRFGDKGLVQPVAYIRYLIADWGDAFGKTGLPLGGLSLTVGANISP